MRKTIVFVSVCLCFLSLVWAQQRQLRKEALKLKPHIDSVTQKNYSSYSPGHIDIVLDGTRFPDPPNGHQIKVGDYLTNTSSPWSSTKICGTLTANIEGGMTYPVVLIKTATNAEVSNKVDYFLTHLLRLNTSTSELGLGKVVEIASCLKLGDKGTKTIVYAGSAVDAVSWEDYKFTFRIPANVVVPSKYEVHLTKGRKILSNKVVISLRGPIK
ncbi:MAG: hypothetical protein JXB23_18710 [Candidatus Aminicenantes bacterium]|nr:hypothetical protein [Candidatus Aminicenantes bacterium]